MQNVSLRHIHETTAAIESNTYYTFMCVRVYACVCVYQRRCVTLLIHCHMHTPYCLHPLWLHHIFQHYPINGTIFEKKSQNIKCML
jgi:hypothetical protein